MGKAVILRNLQPSSSLSEVCNVVQIHQQCESIKKKDVRKISKKEYKLANIFQINDMQNFSITCKYLAIFANKVIVSKRRQIFSQKFHHKPHGSKINSAIHYSLHKKMKFSIKDFFSKCDQIRRKLRKQRIWSHLLKKSLMQNFIFVQWFWYHWDELNFFQTLWLVLWIKYIK